MSVNKEMQTVLEDFLKAWEGDVQRLDSCLSEEPYAYFSNLGVAYTRDEIRNWCAGKEKGLKLHIMNHVTWEEQGKGYEYATVIGLFAKEAVVPRHLAFAGTFVNELVCEKDEWKLRVIRFDLQCEDSVAETTLSREGILYRAPGYGDVQFISNWKKIDDRIGHNMTAIPGAGQRMISPDYDTPWYKAGHMAAENDAEKVKELLYMYCYAFDLATFPLLRDVFDESVKYSNAYADVEWTNRRDTIGFLKMYRKVTPRAHHSVMFEEVKIQGDEATVAAVRIAPEMKNKKFVNDDMEQWAYGSYHYKAKKTDGVWKITEFSYDRD